MMPPGPPSIDPDIPPHRAYAPGWEPRACTPLPARTSIFDVIAKIRFAEASVLVVMVNAVVAGLLLGP